MDVNPKEEIILEIPEEPTTTITEEALLLLKSLRPQEFEQRFSKHALGHFFQILCFLIIAGTLLPIAIYVDDSIRLDRHVVVPNDSNKT